MGASNIMLTGRSGMMGARTGIATAGHNITNANTEGFSRQRVEFKASTPEQLQTKNTIGTGVAVQRISRYNDEYLEKQVRNGAKNLAHMEEKEMHIAQVEDIFNEMGGEGLNRIMSRFFNDFRKLANDPESEAVRQSVRESSEAMITDFKRVRKEIIEVSNHIDSRIEGNVREANSLIDEITKMNQLIQIAEVGGTNAANDLKDQRDIALKRLASYLDISVHKDEKNNISVDIPGVGPLITGTLGEKFAIERSPADPERGKRDGTWDLKTTAYPGGPVTHILKGGKLGAMLEVRDKTLNTVLDRMDDLAYTVTTSVNEIHRQGFTREGASGVEFFKTLPQKARAAEYLGLSDAIKSNVNNIASAAQPDSPGDNRVAVALSGIQGLRILNGGKSTVDDWYNSIVSDVGVISGRNKSDLSQQKSINTQLNKMRDNLSGVSIDEEVANLLQYQHSFDASAKVIQVADSMLETILNLRR